MRYIFQRWAIILLVVTRLIIGEFAHAMPHETMGAATDQIAIQSHDAVQANDAACPDHSGARGTHSSTDSEPGAVKAHPGAAHDGGCCKTNCYCPCLHLSAIVTAFSVANLGMLDQRRLPALAFGQMPERVFLLLRPPA